MLRHSAAVSGATQPANPSLRDPSTGAAINTSVRTMVPLSAIASVRQRATPGSINHQDTELATTVSFNLADGVSLSDAQTIINQAEADIGMPINVRGSFQGTARSFTESLKQEPILIGADDSNPNGAEVCVLVDGAEGPDLSLYVRALILFEDGDAESVAAARTRWTALKAAGHTVTYWQQDENGRWAKKA